MAANAQFRNLLTLPISLVYNAATNPLVTGGLLAWQHRDPNGFTRALDQLRLTSTKGTEAVILRALFAIGLLRSASAYLDVISQNAWKVSADTSSWVWSQEVAVVTGGSNGIGAEIVKELVALGVKVAVLDVVPLSPELEKLNNVHFFELDVTDAEAVETVGAEVQRQVGNVSILINNAGIGTGSAITNRSPDYVKKIFGVNIMSHFYTVKTFLPGMIARNHGHIVSIASLASFVSAPGMADYAATKAGVLSFHESLKQEIQYKHKKDGILTTVVHPGWVKTNLTRKHEEHITKSSGPMLAPSTIGKAIVKQIKAARGAQLVIPERQRFLSTLKAWPHWLQEGLRSALGRQAASRI